MSEDAMRVEGTMRARLDSMVADNGGKFRAAGFDEDGQLFVASSAARGPRFAREQVKIIREMYLANIPLRAIADRIGCDDGVIERYINRMVLDGDITRRKPIARGRKAALENDAEIASHYAAGWPLLDIALSVGKSINAVQIILRRLKATGQVVARKHGKPRRETRRDTDSPMRLAA